MKQNLPVHIMVEYEDIPIKNIAMRCPICLEWFDPRECQDPRYTNRFSTKKTIMYYNCFCPRCGTMISSTVYDYNIKEISYIDVLKE